MQRQNQSGSVKARDASLAKVSKVNALQEEHARLQERVAELEGLNTNKDCTIGQLR